MAMLIRETVRQYQHVFIERADQRMLQWPLMGPLSPLQIAAIIGAYVYFVHHLGPRLMEKRAPFKLDRIIQIYNVIQVAMACYLVERGWSLGWGWIQDGYQWFCEPADYSTNPKPVEIARCCYLYFIIKIVDLLDTVFFVLKKNYRQITFLHVYHHAGMVFGSWFIIRYVPGGHGSFLGFINSVVHGVMYTYYLVTSIKPEHKKNIWWKKYITQMQMLQFLVVILHNIPLLVFQDCGYPAWFALLAVPQNFFMLILFYDFYRKAYDPRRLEEAEQRRKKAQTPEDNKIT